MFSRRVKLIAIGVVAVVAVAVAVVVGWWPKVSAPVADSAPSTAEQEAGMTAGQPLRDMADADLRSLAITLDATQARFDLAGRSVAGLTYSGSFIGPTLRLTPGSDLAITLVNHLPVATNLHFHGLHVSPEANSDNPFRCVKPGETAVYHLHIPADHPVGTFWYHSHAMGTTCPDMAMEGTSTMAGMAMANAGFTPGDSENQVFAGLSGALIIGDDRTLLPAGYSAITERTLMFKDVQLDRTGRIVQNEDGTTIDSNKPTVRLVNGQLRPTLTMRPGETQLWRLVNIGADIFYQLRLDGYRLTVVDEDGRPVAQARPVDQLLLPPAKRYDVVVTAPSAAGETWLRTVEYNNGPQGDDYPETPLAHISVAGDPATQLPAVAGGMPGAPADLASAQIAAHRTVELTENNDSTQFFINQTQGGMSGSTFSNPAHIGTVEEWTVVNRSGEDHPFHLHTNAFQVISVNGAPQSYTHQQDIVVVPHKDGDKPGVVVLRVAFTDYPGRWMFHCHIAAHEDKGMMNYIDVVN